MTTQNDDRLQPSLPGLDGNPSPADADTRSQTAPSGGPTTVDEFDFREVHAFPDYQDIGHGELFTLSLSNHTTPFTHGLHRFPAKFIPQIPRWAISQFTREGDTVLDPFMGSGTTLVEALVAGRHGQGLDLDPLACLIAQAKTDAPDPMRIDELAVDIERQWTPASHLVPPMPDIRNFEHWFRPTTWAELQSLLHLILNARCSEAERRFLLVVFSGILRWVSNADDQTQKTYVSGTNPKSPPDVRSTFWRHYHRSLLGLRSLRAARTSQGSAQILTGVDARDMSEIPEESIDLIVTSPPYLDSVDYMYNLMLEYFWLGPLIGVPDRKCFNQMRHAPVGAKFPAPDASQPPAGFPDLVTDPSLSPARQRAANAYFASMARHFSTAARCLRTGGRYILVVGNSQTSGAILPVHDALLHLAAAADLRLDRAFAYRVRRHYMKFPRGGRGGIILIDWIAVLTKDSGRASPPMRLPLPWATLHDTAVAH